MASIYSEFRFDLLENWMREHGMESWADQLPLQVEKGLSCERYGDLKTWLDALKSIPEISPTQLTADKEVTITSPNLDAATKEQLHTALRELIPWRKGPYNLCDIFVDTEWRSDWKWDRLRSQITPLEGRLVLDAGCGNGYHMWRMLGQGAKRVMGVDPSPRFSVQFEIVKRLAGPHHPIDMIPVPMEAIPRPLEAFDTTFSMGVLYHRREPLEHLLELKDSLRPGGELILESLVIEGNESDCLVPESRYAKMRNVWVIPSSKMMQVWLEKLGFNNVRLINESVTTLNEQRATDWMLFESLKDFLDPSDSSKTIEGYPAPRRAILIAEKPTYQLK